MILMLQCVRSELLKWQLQRLNLISKLCIKLPVAKGICLSYNTIARSLYVFGKSRHLLTTPKRHICAAWDLPRKSKNLRPCVAHFFVLHKVFFLLILSLQITQLPLLSSPSGQEQTQKRYPFFSGQTPILPHYIIVLLPQNGREIPVFFSSRFWREKDRVKKRPCNFLEILQTFLLSFLSNSFISLVISCFLPVF